MSNPVTRRAFLKSSLAVTAAGLLPTPLAFAQAPLGELAFQDAAAKVLFPRDRVPLTFIIDDSTCLVNMGHFCIPQFAAAWPDREEYHKPWHTFPREIPDAFVREFGEWCAEKGVKGKYSIVPYPSCVGWLDRELPGWSRPALQDSLKLVRDLMVPNWDIHPEMITHTRVIDLATGRPFADINPGTMENSFPQVKKSVDEMAAYIAYALRVLRNCELPCEGITTPGGFGNMVKSELSLAVRQAIRDVYPEVQIPHYFKYVSDGDESTEPKLEHLSGAGTDSPEFTVNVPAGTGDWFGSWEGDATPEPDRYATVDATSGRMIELIEQGRPAFMLCHWPGIYCNGTKAGFHAFQRVVNTIHSRFAGRTHWMKTSEIARYWAAKGLTTIRKSAAGFTLSAPYDCPDFTVQFPAEGMVPPAICRDAVSTPLREVNTREALVSGSWRRQEDSVVVCFDLQHGATEILPFV